MERSLFALEGHRDASDPLDSQAGGVLWGV